MNSGTGRSSNATRCRFSRARASGSSGLPLLLGVEVAQPLLVGAVLDVEPLAPLGVEQVGDDADDARGVEDVDDRLRVRGRDPHRGVLASTSWRRRSAAAARSRAAPSRAPTSTIWSSDGVISPDSPTTSASSSTAVSRIRSAGTITPRSIDLVVVAAEDDADDVLADVVDVALHRGEHDLPLRAAAPPAAFSASMNGSR